MKPTLATHSCIQAKETARKYIMGLAPNKPTNQKGTEVESYFEHKEQACGYRVHG